MSKNKKGAILSSVGMVLILSACTQLPPPAWLDTDRDPALPQTQYITGAGCGKTRSEARQQARAEIARALMTRVDAISTLSTEELTTTGKHGMDSSVTRSSSGREQSVSSVALAGVSYPKFYRGSGKICVLAAVDKAKARTIYEGDMSRARSILRRYNRNLSADTGALPELRAAIEVLRAKVGLYQDQRALHLLFDKDPLPDTKRLDVRLNMLKIQQAKNLVNQLATFQMVQAWGVDAAAQDRLTYATAEAFKQRGFAEVVTNPAFLVAAQVEKHSSTFTPEFYGPMFRLHWAIKITVTDAKTGAVVAEKEQEGTTTGKELSTNSILGTVSVYDKEESAFSTLGAKPLLEEMLTQSN